MLLPDELEIIDDTANLFIKFKKLKVQREEDLIAFTDAIHQLQHLIMIRSTRREHPDIFNFKH